MNSLKTWTLMGILTVILVVVGRLIGGATGMLFFLLLSIGMNFFSYWMSGRMAIRMTGSVPVTEQEQPELYRIIRHLAGRANLPMPEVYMTPSPQPNAFATGRNPNNAKVAVTEGILRTLSPRELEGVLAHEMGHIRNHDILISSMAATIAGVITGIANILQWGMIFGFGRNEEDNGGLVGELAAIILAPIAATVVQLAISRSREYKADATGARLVGNPNPLADALERLETYSQHVPSGVSPSASHLFIVNPLRGESLMQLFSTHPPTEERIRRLREMRVLG